jgi:hypothetical protein
MLKEETNVCKHDSDMDWVEMRMSTVPASGNGVFALVPLKRGQLVTAVYGNTVRDGKNIPFTPYRVEDQSGTHVCYIDNDTGKKGPSKGQGMGMFINSKDFNANMTSNAKYVSFIDDQVRDSLPKFYIELTCNVTPGTELLVETYSQLYWQEIVLEEERQRYQSMPPAERQEAVNKWMASVKKAKGPSKEQFRSKSYAVWKELVLASEVGRSCMPAAAEVADAKKK